LDSRRKERAGQHITGKTEGGTFPAEGWAIKSKECDQSREVYISAIGLKRRRKGDGFRGEREISDIRANPTRREGEGANKIENKNT